MEQVKKFTGYKERANKNPIIKMIEDKKRIVKAIENGQDISKIKGIKIVSSL